jgi:3-hydroxyisobutyrate dehydrogenase-like beta-hydroxyacid dehydrogenase
VTVIGLGAMGRALAETFLRQGYLTTVWNRSANKADLLVSQGAVRATTVAEAVTASQLLVVCVVDYTAVLDLLDPHADRLGGRVLVNLTNGTPAQARRLAAWAMAQGAEYLDGGIMAVPAMIGQAVAQLLYSGSQEAFVAHRDTLSHLGTSSYLGNDPGLASLYDLALLSGMYGLFGGFLHAVALVGTERVTATAFLRLLLPWLSGMLEALPALATQIDRGDYTHEVASNLVMQAIAVANIIDASTAQGIRNYLVAPLQALVNPAPARRDGAHHAREPLAARSPLADD